MKQTRREFIKATLTTLGAALLGSISLPDKPPSDAELLPEDGGWHHSVACYEGDRRIWLNIDSQWYDPDGSQTDEPPSPFYMELEDIRISDKPIPSLEIADDE